MHLRHHFASAACHVRWKSRCHRIGTFSLLLLVDTRTMQSLALLFALLYTAASAMASIGEQEDVRLELRITRRATKVMFSQHISFFSYYYNSSQQRVLIVNGEVAKKARYPYFVSLKHYGGGALIAPDIVLTAGHTKPIHRHDVQPKIGTYNFDTDMKGVDFEEFEIERSVRHDGFVRVNDDDFILDFTLLKLKGQSKHAIVRINRDKTVPHVSQQVVAMGMGDTNPSPKKQDISNILRQVELDVISNTECEQAQSEKRNITYHNRIYPSMMCTTGGPHNERDSWCVIIYGCRV